MIVMKPTATEAEVQAVIDRIEAVGARAHPSRGEEVTVIGAIGDREHVARLELEGAPGRRRRSSRSSSRTSSPPRRSGRRADRRRDRRAAHRRRALLADRRAVHGRVARPGDDDRARRRSDAGASLFRGGAYKPRTSPYAFQGLGQEGLRLLAEAKAETGMPIVTELMDARDLEAVLEVADVIQVGARNMQNYPLLAEIGRSGWPGAAQARAVRDARGAADGGGVRPQGGQPERAAVRARDPDLRDGLPLHARPDGDPGAQGDDPPAGDRRPEPRRRPARPRAAAVAGRRRGRGGRDHRRGAPGPRARRSATARSSSTRTGFAEYAAQVERAAALAGKALSARATA